MRKAHVVSGWGDDVTVSDAALILLHSASVCSPASSPRILLLRIVWFLINLFLSCLFTVARSGGESDLY